MAVPIGVSGVADEGKTGAYRWVVSAAGHGEDTTPRPSSAHELGDLAAAYVLQGLGVLIVLADIGYGHQVGQRDCHMSLCAQLRESERHALRKGQSVRCARKSSAEHFCGSSRSAPSRSVSTSLGSIISSMSSRKLRSRISSMTMGTSPPATALSGTKPTSQEHSSVSVSTSGRCWTQGMPSEWRARWRGVVPGPDTPRPMPHHEPWYAPGRCCVSTGGGGSGMPTDVVLDGSPSDAEVSAFATTPGCQAFGIPRPRAFHGELAPAYAALEAHSTLGTSWVPHPGCGTAVVFRCGAISDVADGPTNRGDGILRGLRLVGPLASAGRCFDSRGCECVGGRYCVSGLKNAVWLDRGRRTMAVPREQRMWSQKRSHSGRRQPLWLSTLTPKQRGPFPRAGGDLCGVRTTWVPLLLKVLRIISVTVKQLGSNLRRRRLLWTLTAQRPLRRGGNSFLGGIQMRRSGSSDMQAWRPLPGATFLSLSSRALASGCWRSWTESHVSRDDAGWYDHALLVGVCLVRAVPARGTSDVG